MHNKTFNGFRIARVKAESKEKKIFLPIDVMHDLVKHHKIKINFYFLTQTHFDYRSLYSMGKSNKISHVRARQCHYCSNCHGKKDKKSKHIEHCTGITRIT